MISTTEQKSLFKFWNHLFRNQIIFESNPFLLMGSFCASRQCHELVPVISHFTIAIRITAWPVLFEVMENSFACVILTGFISVLFIQKGSVFAALVRTNKPSFFVDFCFFLHLRSSPRGYQISHLLGSLCLLLLFSIEISGCLYALLFFLYPCFCVRNSWWFPKLNLLGLIRMRANAAAWNFLEFVPIINNFVAAVPPLLNVMENGLAWMKATSLAIVLWFKVQLPTPWSLTSFLSLHLTLNSNQFNILILIIK